MKAYAGKVPWYSGVSESTPTGRQRQTLSSGNYEWDLSEGWHTKRQRGWKKSGLSSGTVTKSKVTAPDGRQVTVYKSTGYDDTIGFHAHNESDEEALAYAFSALDKNNPSHPPIYEEDGCGHIAKLEYAQYEDGKGLGQVLRVTFSSNGAVCIFFRVPSAVAGTLLALARSKAKRIGADGKTERHVLGIEFWDLVRIRGQRHGARYPFEYESRGDYKLTGSNKRYKITLSDKNYKKILGDRYYGNRELKEGDEISAILSEEEYARLVDEHHKQAIQAVKVEEGYGKGGEYYEKEVTGVDIDYYNTTATFDGRTLPEFLDSDYVKNTYGRGLYSRHVELSNKMVDAIGKAKEKRNKEIEDYYAGSVSKVKEDVWSTYQSKADALNNMWNKAVAHFGDENTAARYFTKYKGDNDKKKFITKFFSNGTFDRDKLNDWVLEQASVASFDKALSDSKYRDKRFKTEKLKTTADRVNVKPSDVFNKEEYNDYMLIERLIRRFDNPNKYAATFNGRAWSKQELRDFANATIPGAITPAHAIPYNKLIKSGDYEGALNFLKNRKRNVYVNGKVVAYNRSYATPYDYIVQGD